MTLVFVSPLPFTHPSPIGVATALSLLALTVPWRICSHLCQSAFVVELLGSETCTSSLYVKVRATHLNHWGLAMLWVVTDNQLKQCKKKGKHRAWVSCFRQSWIQGFGPYFQSSFWSMWEPPAAQGSHLTEWTPQQKDGLMWPACPSGVTVASAGAQRDRCEPQAPVLLPVHTPSIWFSQVLSALLLHVGHWLPVCRMCLLYALTTLPWLMLVSLDVLSCHLCLSESSQFPKAQL